jgi:predicted dithiol-disulfide oxidoreductase (DUF899 family)
MTTSFPGESGEYRAARDRLPLMLNVFRRRGETIRHFRRSEPPFEASGPDQDPRHGETIDPQWNLLDFTPAGRGSDCYPDLSYS